METERLILREWRDEDREPFAALNADPEVMANFPHPLTREESDAAVDRFQADIDEFGGLDEIVAYAVAQNTRSRRVMERLGMAHDPASDFVDDQWFPTGHEFGPHVVYRRRNPDR